MQIKPRKKLGQNFLLEKNIQNKIIEACNFTPSDIVLEIGSGTGEMTGLIASRAERVIGVEFDRRLYELLKKRFAGRPDVELVNADILKFDLRAKKRIKVFGNIPYYISTPIIEYLIEHRDKISVFFLTMQKELARRITAPGGSREGGSFSYYAQYYTEPGIVFDIKRGSFTPQPKVDSSLVKFTVRDKPAAEAGDEELLFKLIRAAFNQRRKTLRNSLSKIVPAEALEKFFVEHNIERSVRPERLSLRDFADLSRSIAA